VSWRLDGSHFETCSCDVVCPCTASMALGATRDGCRATRSQIDVFGIQYGAKAGFSASHFAWAA